MQSDNLWNDFSALPVDAQRQVTELIANLRQRYLQQQPKKKLKKLDLREEPFIGIWKDREDMQDSSAWVRNLRESEWKNR